MNLTEIIRNRFTEITEIDVDIDRLVFCTYMILMYFVYIYVTCVYFLRDVVVPLFYVFGFI